MKPEAPEYPTHPPPGGKLSGKVALINDTSSELGWAVANLFAREGADVMLSCVGEDPQRSTPVPGREDQRCLTMSGDAADVSYCIDAVERTLIEYGGLDILVNTAASIGVSRSTAIPADTLEGITNSLACTLLMTQSALFYLGEGGAIINTIPMSGDESASSAATCLAAGLSLTNFTRTLAKELAPRQIRVNGIGLRRASETGTRRRLRDQEKKFRVEPGEIAPSYLFLASRDSSRMTGQILYLPGNSPA